MGAFDHITPALKQEGQDKRTIVLGELSFKDYEPRTGPTGRVFEGRYRGKIQAGADTFDLVPIAKGGGVNVRFRVQITGPEAAADGGKTAGIGKVLRYQRALHDGEGENPTRDRDYLLSVGWSCLTAMGDPEKLEKAKAGAPWKPTGAWLDGKECFVYVAAQEDDPRYDEVVAFIPREQYEARPGPVPEGERIRKSPASGPAQTAIQGEVPEALGGNGSGVGALKRALKLGGKASAPAAAGDDL